MGVCVDDEIMGVCINGKIGGGVFAGFFPDGCPTTTHCLLDLGPGCYRYPALQRKIDSIPIYTAVDNFGVAWGKDLYWVRVTRRGKELLVIYGYEMW